jgi:hypothetical protein
VSKVRSDPFTSWINGRQYQPAQCIAGFASGSYGAAFASEYLEYGDTYAYIFSAWMDGERSLGGILTAALKEYPNGNLHPPHLTLPYGGGPPRWRTLPPKPGSNIAFPDKEWAPDLRFIGDPYITRANPQ